MMKNLREMAISIGWRIDDRALRAANQATDEYKESVEQGERSMISLGQKVSQIGTQMGDSINKTGIYIDGLGRDFREVEIGAERSLRDVGHAIDEVGDKIHAIPDPQISGAQAAGELKGVETHADRADAAIDAISDPVVNTSQAQTNLKGAKKDADDLKDAIGAIGGFVAGSAIGSSLVNFGQMRREFQVRLGVDADSAAGLTDSAKEVFQSVKDLSEAGAMNVIIAANRSFDATGERASQLGTGIANLSSITEVSMDRIARGAKLMQERFDDVRTPDRALDIYTEAAQRLDSETFEELLDNTEEYGKNIAAIGLSANDFFGVMIQAGEKSRYVMDRLGDSVFSEFVPKVAAGNEQTMEMLSLLGGSTEQAEKWRTSVLIGGNSGKRAFGEIVAALNGYQQENKKAQIGTELFGTMFEEQGKDILTDLGSITNGVGELGQEFETLEVQNEGAWNRMKSIWKSSLAELDSMTQGAFGDVAEVIGGALPFAIGAFMGTGGLGKLTQKIGGALKDTDKLKNKMKSLGGTATRIGPQLLRLAGPVGAIGTVAYLTYQNWDLMWSKMEEVGKGISDLVNKLSFHVELPEWLGGDFKFGLPSGEGIAELGGGIKSDTMGQGFKNFLKPLIPFADGGLVTGPTLGLVGEAGEHEVIAPVSKLDSFLDNLTRQYAPTASAAMPPIHFNPVYQVSGTSQNNDQLVNDLRRRMKQDFNQLMQDWFRQQQKFFPNTIKR